MRVIVHDIDLIPERKHETDAGLDLKASRTVVLMPGERYLMDTGVSFQVNHGCYVQLRDRSGLAVKHGISVLAGVIDRGYTGEIKACLINHGDDEVIIQRGDRICQAIELPLEPTRDIFITPDGDTIQAETLSSVRGGDGFGSTGK